MVRVRSAKLGVLEDHGIELDHVDVVAGGLLFHSANLLFNRGRSLPPSFGPHLQARGDQRPNRGAQQLGLLLILELSRMTLGGEYDAHESDAGALHEREAHARPRPGDERKTAQTEMPQEGSHPRMLPRGRSVFCDPGHQVEARVPEVT